MVRTAWALAAEPPLAGTLPPWPLLLAAPLPATARTVATTGSLCREALHTAHNGQHVRIGHARSLKVVIVIRLKFPA